MKPVKLKGFTVNEAGLSKAFIALQLFGLLLHLIVLIHRLKAIPVRRMGFPRESLMDNILKVSCRLGSFRHRLSPGCTTWSTAEISSDSRPHHGDRKRCIVKDGVASHAVCCHAPSLECHLLENISADKDEVNILFRLKCLKTFHQPFTLSHCRCSLAGRGVLSLWLDYDRL